MIRYKYPFYIMIHPFQGFEDLKYNRDTSLIVSNLILLAWIITQIFTCQYQGFIFNYNDQQNFNVLLLIVETISKLILWVISNWAFCVLLDGKAKFKEIWIITTYALLPLILFNLVNVFISNYMITDEQVFIIWLGNIGTVWSIFLLIIGLMTFHEYSFSKTIVSIVLTLIGILIIVFLLFLFFSLAQQVIFTIITIVNEIMFRI